MSNRAKYQMARGEVAKIAESLGYYSGKGEKPEEAVKSAIENEMLRGICKDSVCRIARRLGYPVQMVLGKWIIKTTGEEL